MKTYIAAACGLAFGVLAAAAQTSPQKTNSGRSQSAEIEYLRRLLAEQQKHLDKIIRTLPPDKVAAPTNGAAPAREKAAATPPPAAAPTNVTPASVAPPTQQEKISEVEARIDAMLRQKEAREKAALTNAAGLTNSVPATPQTKRQRLDALLKQFIEGKVPEAEYNEKRARILAEPD